MEDRKYVQKLLETSKHFNIDKNRHIDLKDEYTPYEGTPKRHPSNENIIILVTNPFEQHKQFYEFYMDTIAAIEEIGTITSEEKKSAYTIRLWVKNGTMAVRSETFIV